MIRLGNVILCYFSYKVILKIRLEELFLCYFRKHDKPFFSDLFKFWGSWFHQFVSELQALAMDPSSEENLGE